MSKNEIGSTIQVAQKLVKHLPKETGDQLKLLIQRAENGQNTTRQIMQLLRPHENVRRWMKEQINAQGGQVDGTRGYENLAGYPSSVPRSKKWTCPKAGCTESLPVIQEGEDPPICEEHKIEMVRKGQSKGLS